MGNCISHVSSLCRGKAPSSGDPTIHAEGESEHGINSTGDVETQRQLEEERLRKLRQEYKVLERERLRKSQAVAQAKLQKEHVEKQLAEHEEERKRLAFDLQKRKERHPCARKVSRATTGHL